MILAGEVPCSISIPVGSVFGGISVPLFGNGTVSGILGQSTHFA